MADSLCPLCQQPVFTPEEFQWEVMGSNNMFARPWSNMLPRGVKLARIMPGPEPQDIKEVPKFLHVDTVRELYTCMHSRCVNAQKKAYRQQERR
jgi:hypothetical protein